MYTIFSPQTCVPPPPDDAARATRWHGDRRGGLAEHGRCASPRPYPISCSGLCRGDREGHPAASQQHIALAPHARPLTRSRGRLIVGSSLRFVCGRRAHRMSPARQRRACARRCSDDARREEGDKCRGSSGCKTCFTSIGGGERLPLCPLFLLQQCASSELRMQLLR